MAYVKKLFQSYKFGRQNSNKLSVGDTKSDWKKPQFDDKNIRLVLFLDTDIKGRRIIFDSKAVITEEEKTGRSWCRPHQKLSSLKEGKIQASASNQKCKYSYEPHRTGSESKMLEEMMFGAEGFAYKGTSLKVHVIRKPPQLMLTKVFIPERHKRAGLLDSEESNSFSSAPDLSIPRTASLENREIKGVSHSVPMDVPSPRGSWSFDLIDEDSGLASMTSSGSFQPYPSPGSNGSSCNSLNRRWQRGLNTTLEGSLRRRSMQDILANEVTASNRPKKRKMALGIIFYADENSEEANRMFENFFFSHIALIEGHLEQLRNCVERAYYSDRQFLPRMIEAFDFFKKDITDLYTAPRLSEPVWLNMMSFSSYKYMLCEKFIREFVGLASKFDSKNTNFFMSTLITGVLTHHLAWVPTVIPAGGSPSNTYLDKHSAKWVDTLAKTHPYNPLWAQLGDLYGAIGFPLKLSRTVIVGKKSELVKKMLYVLSYFIRCSDVLETGEFGSLESYLSKLNFAETPVDTHRSTVSSTPTPVNSHGCTPQSFPSFCPLPLDSLLSSKCNKDDSSLGSKCNADDTERKDHNSNDKIPGAFDDNDMCNLCDMNRRSGDFTEKKVGKSVFYIEPEACNCDRSSQPRNSDKPNPTECYYQDQGGGEGNNVSNSSGHCKVAVNANEIHCHLHPSCTESTHCDIKKRKEKLKLDIPNQESLRSNSSGNMNANMTSLLTTQTELKRCKLSASDILDNPKVINVQHVRKSSDTGRIEDLLNVEDMNINSLKSNTGSDINKLSKEVAQSIFLKQGSNSMFNEYFEEEGVETKTIDDIDEKDRVVDLPAKKNHVSATEKRVKIDETSSKAPSLPDLTANPLKSETAKSHRSRLGSLDQNYKQRRASLSRQISENAPGRCRPVTPTELGKRRHMSSTSSFDIDLYDPRAFCQELPMPGLGCDFNCSSQKDFDKNFGRSLLADYSDHYLSDFVLHGTSERGFEDRLSRDIRMGTQCSVLDEPIAEAVYIVADTDNWTVKTYSSQHIENCGPTAQPVLASQLISNLVEAVVSMSKLKMSPEFCVMHLEDRLQEVYFKSKMLAEYLSRTKNRNVKELLTMLGFDRSDLPLLVAIAGTHTPNFPIVYLS